MQRSKSMLFSLLAVAGIASFTLTGCGAEAADSASVDADTNSEDASVDQTEEVSSNDSSVDGEASLSYGDTTYTAKLQSCSLSGDEDALFHGVTHDASGNEVGYLDGDFGSLNDAPYGEVRINFGASAQFESTDKFIALGDAVSHIVVTDFSDDGLIIMGGAWDQDGTEIPSATLKVKC